MSHSICFVTPQIYPGMAGGIGRLIQANALALVRAGWQVTLLLDVPDEALRQFRRYQAKAMPTAIVATPAELLATPPPTTLPPAHAFAAEAHWRAYRLALALNQLLEQHPFDGVELVDYQGSGYVIAQWRRLLGGPLTHTRLWLRLHGSSELWQQADGLADFSSGSLIQHQMERYTLAHVDGWLASSLALARQYQTYYHLQRPVVAQAPAFERLGPGSTHPRQVDRQNLRLLFYGKLQPLKGADILVQAAVRLCRQLDARLDVDLVGGEDPGLAARFGSYTDRLRAVIPPQFQDRFHFHGPIDPAQLPALAHTATLAVVPSRIETFCLAAHELNWLGVPLVLNDIPAFADYFTHGRNCLKFDGSASHLAEVLYTALTATSPFAGWDNPTSPLADAPDRVYQTALRQFSPLLPAGQPAPPTAAVVRHVGPAIELFRTLASLATVTPGLSQIVVVAAPGSAATALKPEFTVATMAQALGRITAPYILLLDSGATLVPEFGNRLQRAQAHAPQAEVIGCYTRWRDGRPALVPAPPDLRLLLFENRLSWSGCVFKREILRNCWQEPADAPTAQWEFWLRLVRAGGVIEIIPQSLHCAPAPPAPPPLAAAGQLSQLLVRYPDLVEQFGAEVIKLYAFNYHQLASNCAHDRKTWLAERQELEGRFASRHIITRQFVHLTRTTILKVSRNPVQAWQKLRTWLISQIKQSL